MPQPLDTPARQFALRTVRQLREAGYQALWAGGCVRDEILGRTPKDYDIATSARPEQVREVFGRRRTLAVGAAFGVIIVVGHASEGQIDVATFRSDGSYTDGRRPDAIHYSTAEEDAARRDFTINGLFYDPVEQRIQDFVEGQADLQRRVLRAIGNAEQRFAEDKLRMLRAVRMAAIFEFAIDPATMTAIRQHASDITVVSGERIAAEMRRLLADSQKAQGLRLLHDSGLLSEILPEVNALVPAQDSATHNTAAESSWQRTLQVLGSLGETSFAVGLAGVLHYATTGSTSETRKLARGIGSRWRLSTQEIEQTTWLLLNEPLVRQAQSLPWHALQPVLIDPLSAELLQLAAAIAGEDLAAQAGVAFCRQKVTLPTEVLNPAPLLNGHDLLELGVPASRVLQTLLQETRNEQLEGRLHTKEQALAWAKGRWSELADQ